MIIHNINAIYKTKYKVLNVSNLNTFTNSSNISTIPSSILYNRTYRSRTGKIMNVLLLLFLVFGSCVVNFGMKSQNDDEKEENENQFPVYNPSNYANNIDGDNLLLKHFIHAYHNVPDINNAINTLNGQHMQDNINTIKNAIQNYRDYMDELNKAIESNQGNQEIQKLYKTEQKSLKQCLTKNKVKYTYNLITFLKSKGILGQYSNSSCDTIKSFFTNNANTNDVKNFIDKIINDKSYVNKVLLNNDFSINNTQYQPFKVINSFIEGPLLNLYYLVSEKYTNQGAIKVFSTICEKIPQITKENIEKEINEDFINDIGMNSMNKLNHLLNCNNTQHIIPEDYSPFKYTILPWCIVTFMSGLGGYDNTWINLLTFTKYNIQCNLYIYKSHILLGSAGVNMKLRLPYAIPFLKNILNIHLIGFNILSFLLGILTTFTFNPNDGNIKYYNDHVGKNKSSFLFALRTAFLVHGQMNKHDFIYLHYPESYEDVAFRISLAATFFINTIQFLSFDFKVLNYYHISINLGTLLMSWLMKYIKSTSGEVYQDIDFIKIIDTELPHNYGSIFNSTNVIQLDNNSSSDDSKSKSNSGSSFLKSSHVSIMQY